jgi:HSP20 family protein
MAHILSLFILCKDQAIIYIMNNYVWLLHAPRAWISPSHVEEQVMAWRRRYLFGPFWSEFDDFMQDMETQFNEMLEELATTKALPGQEMRARMLPAIRGEFRVDVKEHDDEVIVAADLPGVEKEDVSLEVLDPRTLKIAFSRQEETKEEVEGYFVRERTYGSMDRLVRLPSDVTEDGAAATFKNGVLEVRLKKTTIAAKTKIPIE